MYCPSSAQTVLMIFTASKSICKVFESFSSVNVHGHTRVTRSFNCTSFTLIVNPVRSNQYFSIVHVNSMASVLCSKNKVVIFNNILVLAKCKNYKYRTEQGNFWAEKYFCFDWWFDWLGLFAVAWYLSTK